MQEIFKKFDNLATEEISKFYNSDDDILVLYGAKGCGKSSLVKRSLETPDKNFLTFHHNCFQFGTIDDFLLNFYDSFKNYSMSKNITLKKTVANHFSNKVINYFKETEHNFLITVDNFELVSQKKEIVDFLFHIAGFKNVKLILISSIDYKIPIKQSKIKTCKIEIKPNTLEEFSEKITHFFPFSSKGDIETFFKAASGSELHLRMSISYLKSSSTTFHDFINEYEKKNLNFENFLINKIVSIIPENYYKTMKNFSLLYHCSVMEFLDEYSIAKHEEVEYLLQKMALTKTSQGLYLKNYLKNFFNNKLSVQEKIIQCGRLIEIYEKELAKSPKDRLLRLSRESIRNLINHFNQEIPKINYDQRFQQNFSYMAQTHSNIVNWNKLTKEGSTDNNPVKEDEPKKLSALDYFKQAEEFENVYNYQKAIDCLNQARFLNENETLNAKILSKLAKNYLKTNNFDFAINCEIKLYDLYKNTDKSKAYNSLYRTGLIYKNLFNYKKAIEYFDKILLKPDAAPVLVYARTLLSYGEIEEQENKTKNAFEKYNKIVETLENKVQEGEKDGQKMLPLLCEAYYKIAQIYDTEQKLDLAKEFYQKNIEASKKQKVNAHLGLSYLNLADMFFDEQDIKTALKNYNSAILIFEKTKNFEELYFIYKKLAQNFEYSDPDLRFEYLKHAKNLAMLLKDNFKLAYCHVEIGDYYYFVKNDKEALLSFFEAKEAIGINASDDNISKINSRIEDMKIKMGEENFKKTLQEFRRG